MTITAKSVLASVSPDGVRIDTLLLRYPRFIHAEALTHRVISTQPEGLVYESIPDGLMYCKELSRNASSSRAIPVNRLIADVESDPVYPIFWGKNQPGMQAREELEGEEKSLASSEWMDARDRAVQSAKALSHIGAHKQIVNRILEPFAHINVVVTSTEWDNFFALRIHEDAQPEIKALAEAMRDAMDGANVQKLDYGRWHLPFVSKEETRRMGGLTDPSSNLRVVSAARCARTSYKTHDGRVSTLKEDIALGERLTKSRPFHASPFEHQAMPDMKVVEEAESDREEWVNPEKHRNFTGWMQNRAFMEEEL